MGLSGLSGLAGMSGIVEIASDVPVSSGNIVSITENGSKAQFNTGQVHTLVVSDQVTLAGLSLYDNGDFAVLSVPSATSFMIGSEPDFVGDDTGTWAESK